MQNIETQNHLQIKLINMKKILSFIALVFVSSFMCAQENRVISRIDSTKRQSWF